MYNLYVYISIYIYIYLSLSFLGMGWIQEPERFTPNKKSKTPWYSSVSVGINSSTASASDMGMVQDYRTRSSTPSGNQTYVVKSPTKLGKTRVHMYTWYMIIVGFFQQTMFDWWRVNDTPKYTQKQSLAVSGHISLVTRTHQGPRVFPGDPCHSMPQSVASASAQGTTCCAACTSSLHVPWSCRRTWSWSDEPRPRKKSIRKPDILDLFNLRSTLKSLKS